VSSIKKKETYNNGSYVFISNHGKLFPVLSLFVSGEDKSL